MIRSLAVTLVVLFFSSCYSFSLVRDDINKKYIYESFGDYSWVYSGEFPGTHYNLLEQAGRNSIMQDSGTSMKEKEEEIKNFKEKFKWEKNSFYYIWLYSNNAFTDKEIDFKLDLVDRNLNSIVDYRQKFWIKVLFGYGGTQNHYYWIIKSKKPITKDNYDESQLPIYLNVTFPNGKVRRYQITL